MQDIDSSITSIASVLAKKLQDSGLDAGTVTRVLQDIEAGTGSASETWNEISRNILTPEIKFDAHLDIYHAVFNDWETSQGPRPAWSPTEAEANATNLASLLIELQLDSYQSLHRWSVENRFEFWENIIDRLNIKYSTPPISIIADESEVESPDWLPGAKFNIVDTCFSQDKDNVAIVHAGEDGAIKKLTSAELETLTNRVANGIVNAGLKPGDAIAIDMPMTAECVAIYLGIIRAGCAVVSIADSFAPGEIATRLRVSNAKAIFTQDCISRSGKLLPLYEKVKEAQAPLAIVLPAEETVNVTLRAGDLEWQAFLSDETEYKSIDREPGDCCNILFSSGTTGDPKAIPWTQTTPIKCAADAYLHHDMHPGDVVAWPTNIGWMMGPWLIFAALINKGTIALFDGAPTGKPFGEFIQNAKVTMLGVVPSLVKAWRNSNCLDGLDWSSIRAFSSTGECSNAEDMLWLMSRAGYKPVIEYCGGTEIGGGYITGTMVQPASPATFTTPSLGLDLVILDDGGSESETGEVFLIPPSIGLSNTLLNRDHHEVYFNNTPLTHDGCLLRRHGDELTRLGSGNFQALGRADDTMNLGGIKISSAEIERVLNSIEGVLETAAIASTPPGGGPDRLVIFVVAEPEITLSSDNIKPAMQKTIKFQLNPLFHIHDVEVVDSLPRTASNKVMRRSLRAEYQAKTD